MRVVAFLVLACDLAIAQPAHLKPAFDVASVKIAADQSPNGGSRTGSPETGRFRHTKATVHDLLMEAYHLRARYEMAGPDWLFVPWMSATKLEVAATFPPGTSEDQFRLMLQDLLETRFHLIAHHEMKDQPVFELVVANGGLKMKESDVRTGGVLGFGFGPDGRRRLKGQTIPISTLLVSLENELSTLVADKTRLTGFYDFSVDYESLGPATGLTGTPEFSTVLGDLGLKLEKKKGLVDVLVIDHLDRQPTGN